MEGSGPDARQVSLSLVTPRPQTSLAASSCRPCRGPTKSVKPLVLKARRGTGTRGRALRFLSHVAFHVPPTIWRPSEVMCDCVVHASQYQHKQTVSTVLFCRQ
jgi:hypothetical protein